MDTQLYLVAVVLPSGALFGYLQLAVDPTAKVTVITLRVCLKYISTSHVMVKVCVTSKILAVFKLVSEATIITISSLVQHYAICEAE